MSIFPQMSGFDLWMIINWFRRRFKNFFFYQIFKCRSTLCWSFLKWVVPYDSMFLFVCVFSHYFISVMSIFPQMSDFDLWMIINSSDSYTELNVSFTKFSNFLRPVVVFLKLMVLYDSMIFLVSIFSLIYERDEHLSLIELFRFVID